MAVMTHRDFVSKPTQTVGALVMGEDYRGLEVVRSLGRHRIPVWVLSHGDHLLATASRYARRVIRWPDQDAQQRIEFLLDLAHREGIADWVLFPTSDPNAALVARNHDVLSRSFRLTTAPWSIFEQTYNKKSMYELADRIGVAHPWTAYPASRRDISSGTYIYPVILKPAYGNSSNRFRDKAWQADNERQLIERYDEMCRLLRPDAIMIQEVIPGGGECQFSYTALCKDGRAIASLTARRSRQIPMDFGRASTFVETVEDPGMSDSANSLIQTLGFTGIAEIEFKRDPRNGQLKLLDFNSRVWGWQSLCGEAGVDYPYLLWLLTLGKPIPPAKAVSGVRWVRMSTDGPTAIREILRGRLSLIEYLRSIKRPHVSAIYASDDPLPGLLEIPFLAFLLLRRAFHLGGMSHFGIPLHPNEHE